MSSLSKFKFKSMKSKNEEDVFEGFSPEDFSQSTFYSNSKLATLKEIIKELDPQYIFKNTNICDFGGFTDEDISEGNEYVEFYNDLYRKWLLLHDLYVENENNSDDTDFVEPCIIKENLVQEIALKPDKNLNVSDIIHPKTHVFIKNGSQRGQDLIIDSDGYTYTQKSNKNDNPANRVYRCSKRDKNSSCKAKILPCR